MASGITQSLVRLAQYQMPREQKIQIDRLKMSFKNTLGRYSTIQQASEAHGTYKLSDFPAD